MKRNALLSPHTSCSSLKQLSHLSHIEKINVTPFRNQPFLELISFLVREKSVVGFEPTPLGWKPSMLSIKHHTDTNDFGLVLSGTSVVFIPSLYCRPLVMFYLPLWSLVPIIRRPLIKPFCSMFYVSLSFILHIYYIIFFIKNQIFSSSSL